MVFVKGQSGNPGGRPHVKLRDGRSLAEVAREHTESAINTLVAVMEDEQQTGAARVSAAGHILDRGWGKPKQDVELSGPDGSAVKLDVTKLTDDQLKALEAIGYTEA